jgi:hypothetical protein
MGPGDRGDPWRPIVQILDKLVKPALAVKLISPRCGSSRGQPLLD